MRNLNPKQKKLLTQVAKRMNYPTSVNDLPIYEYNTVFNVNPHENFDRNVDRFLFDLKMDVVYR